MKQKQTSQSSARTKGYFQAVMAAVTYGMIPLFTLPLYQEGLNADSVLFYRYALAVLILGILLKLKGQSFALKWKELAELSLAGIIFAFSSLFLFLSYRKMDAGIASTLLFVYPVMVTALMAAFFHEKITVESCLSILLALIGVSLLYRKADGSPLNFIGFLFVMFSALSFAVYMIALNRSGIKNMSGTKVTFYVLLFGLSVYLVRLKFGMDLQWLPSWKAGGLLVVMAVVATAISLTCTALAVHNVGATPTAILGALEPVTAIFFGVMVFGEQLSVRIIAGVLLILAGVSLVICGTKPRKVMLSCFKGIKKRG